MGAVPVNDDGFEGNGSTELKNGMPYNEHKDIANGLVNRGQGSGSSGEDEPGSNGSSVNVNNSAVGVNVGSGLQKAQQPLGSGIRWERFLPVRSLKVLLVENDDSTRHVVSALLRNCYYEVMAASDGLEAWSVLQDQSNRIDLVLTEVVMPLLSGVGLLCKITSHKKNIPVIMMSSHDSMGVVFKCLSKGAADFLVKPIRKNELKNLWQHVWRRCHSSSVSGSESGTQTKRSAKSKSSDGSETNTCSSEEHDNGSNGLSNRDGSDDGSGAQSSWTKRAANVDSPQPMSPHKLTEPDSTCAQVIQLMPGTDTKSWVCEPGTKDYQEQYENDNDALGKDLKIGSSGEPDPQYEYQLEKVSSYSVCKRQNNLPELESKPFDIGDKTKKSAPKSSHITSSNSQKAESRDISTPNGLGTMSHIQDKACCDTEDTPSLELTLNRVRGVDGGGTAKPDDRNVLRHSDLSAFSKYNTASSANQIPMENVESCSPLNNSVGMKMGTTHDSLSHSNGTPNQTCNVSSKDDVASSNIVPPKAEGCNENPESISSFRFSHSSPFQPLNSGISSLQGGTTSGTEDVIGSASNSHLRSPYHKIQIQHHHHHHHHYHHHVHRPKQHQPQCDEQTRQKMAAAAPQCGSSNAVAEPTEGNSGNCSVNGSVSGSNHGSNGQIGSTTLLNARVEENTENDHGAIGSKGAGSTSGRIIGNGADDDRVALREAALTKFRLKRKERCFDKRVRYQSRKRLAEQRPRVKGQFVKQIVSDSSTGKDDNQSNDLVSEDNSCDSLK